MSPSGVSIVFGEFYHGLGWLGAVIFIVGASMGALAVYLFKNLRAEINRKVDE